MALEKYLPNQQKPKKSLLKRIFNRNLATPESRKRIDYEFFNADKSKKFGFREFRNEAGETYQLNISLSYVLGNGWVKKTQVMTRKEGNQQYYGVELDTISNNPGETSIYYYNRETGGKKAWSGMKAWSMDLSSIEAQLKLEQLGIIKESDLPEFIDYEKTARKFLLQAKKLDFDTEPFLYPKELIPSEPQAIIPETQ